MRAELEEAYLAFVRGSAAPLRRFAYLLCGDWHVAEDVVQNALVKIYRSWPRLRRHDTMDRYARQAVLRCWLDESRRPWRRAERRDGVVPDLPGHAGAAADPLALGQSAWTREVVLRALTAVPPRQRAVLVLRYWEDRPVSDVAAALGCSEGTVKSQTSRGLATLRRELAAQGIGSRT